LAAAKARLPLPQLMQLIGDGARAKPSAHCPFHRDASPSFSVYRAASGLWKFQCFAGCGRGDEIDYLRLRLGMGNGEAIGFYLRLAGIEK